MRNIVLQGWRDLPLRAKGIAAIGLPLLAVLLMVLTADSLQEARQNLDGWIRRAFLAGSRVQQAHSVLLMAERNAHLYLLTGAAEYRGALDRSEAEFRASLRSLIEAIGDSQGQLDRARRIEALGSEQLRELQRLAYEGPSPPPLAPGIRRLAVIQQEIEATCGEIRAAESRLWAERIASERKLRTRLLWGVYAGALVGVVAGTAIMILFVAGIVSRAEVLKENALRFARGDELLPLPPGADELSDLAAALRRSAHVLGSRERQLRSLTADLEREIRESRMALELESAERRRSEEQLLQSQKMEAIGLLVGGVAHDFNNLLTVINGYTELASSELPPSNRLQENLQQIRAAAGQASALTRRLLAFSRKQVVTPMVVSVNDVLADMSKLLQRLIGEDIQVACDCVAEPTYVSADCGELQQVIMNLAVNARDAMPAGGLLRLHTRVAILEPGETVAQTSLPPGRYILLRVTDTGVGMDPETRRRIFEPFFTTKQPGAGTGLGLSTVYGIVTRAGGAITVTSESGAGTIFDIYLPSVAAASDVRPVVHESVADGGGETILVVEDQHEVRGYIRRALSLAGYAVHEAAGAEEAVSFCAGFAGPLHLIVMDIVIPHKNGPELVTELRDLRSDFAVLFISGYAEEIILRKTGPDAANTPYLQKPFSKDRLVAKVREALGASRGRSSQAGSAESA